MRILPALALPVLLAACQQAAPDRRGVARDETLLTVTAAGRAETRPDEARLQLGVQSDAATAGDASRLNREKMDRVTSALGRLGVKPDDLQTRNISLSRIDYGPQRGRFRADNMVEVRIRDIDRVSEAIAAATQAGANILSGPDLRVSDQETANRSAYAQAYKAARARAEAYAQAAGLKIARVLTIRETGTSGGEIPYPPPIARGMAVAQTAAPPPPAIMPGMNVSQVRIQVDFALAE